MIMVCTFAGRRVRGDACSGPMGVRLDHCGETFSTAARTSSGEIYYRASISTPPATVLSTYLANRTAAAIGPTRAAVAREAALGKGCHGRCDSWIANRDVVRLWPQ